VGLVAALPYVFACIGSIYNSRRSDRLQERRWHVAIPCAIAGVSLILSAAAGGHFPVLAVALLCVTGLGIYAAIGPMWAMLTEVIPPASTGVALGLINGLANLGGFAGPFAVGALRDGTASFFSGFLFLGACLILAGLCSILVHIPEQKLSSSLP
jgi:ACS family tartrate transporter-like MFS transporter